jgi:hypothetical protein
VSGRSDIDVWNNRETLGAQLVRIAGYEAACLLAFALAALVAANLLATWPARRAARLRAAQILRTE